MTFWSQPIMGCNLMAAPEQVNNQHRSYPDGYPSRTLNKQRYKASYRNIKSSNSTPKENGGHIYLLHLFLQKEASSFSSIYEHCLDPLTIPEISHVSRQSFQHDRSTFRTGDPNPGRELGPFGVAAHTPEPSSGTIHLTA